MKWKRFIPGKTAIIVMTVILIISLPGHIIRIAQDPAIGIGYTIGTIFGLYLFWLFWKWLGNLGMKNKS